MIIAPEFFTSLSLTPTWDGIILPEDVIAPRRAKVLGAYVTWAVFIERPRTSPELVGFYDTQEECEGVAGMLEMLRE